MSARFPGGYTYTVPVTFTSNVPLRQKELKGFVERAIASEPGAYPPESPFREIQRHNVKAGKPEKVE